MRRFSVCFPLAAIYMLAADSLSPNWPQFRGPGGSGVGDERAALPTEFGPNKNVVWQTPLPSGHGSPCIWGNRIFVTSFDAGKKLLEAIAIDRSDGKIVWRKRVDPPQIEKVHEANNPASSTRHRRRARVHLLRLVRPHGLRFRGQGRLAASHASLWRPLRQWNLSRPRRGSRACLPRLPPDPALIAVSKKDGTLAWKADLEKVRFQSSV